MVGRETILAAAVEVMRRTPPAQVTRLAIAEQAGVNPALVRYYFGSLSHLKAEVVMGSHGEFMQTIDRVPADRAEEWLSVRIDTWLSIFVHNPYHQQMLREVMYDPDRPAEHAVWAASMERSLERTRRALERGAQDGKMRAVDERFLHLAMAGMIEFFASNPEIIADLFGSDATPETLKESYSLFVQDLLLNGLRARQQ